MVLFNSKMERDQIKTEITKYVQGMQTTYNNQIQNLQRKLEKQLKSTQNEKTKNANSKHDRTELEQLFNDCVSEIRKDVIRRRLKTEVSTNLKSVSQQSLQSERPEFEETLEKLAEMAKDRIKIEEFTLSDRINLLDLFVNNQKVLTEIHDILFNTERVPANKAPSWTLSARQSTTMMNSDTALNEIGALNNSSAFDSKSIFDTVPAGKGAGPLALGRNRPTFVTIDHSTSILNQKSIALNQNSETKKTKLPAIQASREAARSDQNL